MRTKNEGKRAGKEKNIEKRVSQLRYHCTILYMYNTTKFSASISIFDITTFVKVDANTIATFVAKDLFLSLIVSSMKIEGSNCTLAYPFLFIKAAGFYCTQILRSMRQ